MTRKLLENLSEVSNCKSDLFYLPFSPCDKTLQAELNQAVIPKSKEGSKSALPSSSDIDSFAVWLSVEIVQPHISLQELKQVV